MDKIQALYPNIREMEAELKAFNAKKKKVASAVKEKLATPADEKIKDNIAHFQQQSNLPDILRNDSLRPYFKAHLTNEMCIESLLCFEQIHLFKKLEEPAEMEKAAKALCDNFFKKSSIMEINVEDATKEMYCAKVAELQIHPEMFDAMEAELITVMRDSFFRFTQKKLFRDMCAAAVLPSLVV